MNKDHHIKDLMDRHMTKAQIKEQLKNRVVPHLMGKAKKTFVEAERYFEAMWENDPNPVSIETKLGLHRADVPRA